MTKFSVLIADDEVWVRENLRRLLAEEDTAFTVLEPAVDGEAALARIEIERPGLLITDIDMPFLNGNALIKAAKSRWPDLQVIVLSGYADFEYVRQALIDGAIDYLLKPVARDELLRVMGKAAANLQGKLTREQELAEQTDTLQRAAALVRDGAFSALLQDEPVSAVPAHDLTEFDFDFSVFTLLLVKVAALTHRPREGEPVRLAARVKALIGREASDPKTVIFHNLAAGNEFVVLTGRDTPGIDRLGTRLAENLERFTGSRIEVAASAPFYSFGKLKQAYLEAKAAFLIRTADDPDPLVKFETVRHRSIQGRLTPELERLLTLAIDSEDKRLIREVIFEKIGLGGAADWLLIEVKQTAEHLAALLFQHTRSGAQSTLAHGHFQSLLLQALEARDVAEVGSLLDKGIDELFGNDAGQNTSPSMKQTVRKVQDYIAEKYCENLSLTTLSQVFRVDGSYLSKAFKLLTGSNLMSAVAKRRIEKAEEYIRDRNLSLTEVASLVGYEEYAYFNRVFHKIAGVSPRDYRSRYGRVSP